MAGWIALRFLNDPSTALEHFTRIDEGSADPVVRARAAYWRGRAAEAAGRFEEMPLSTRLLPAIPPPITASWRMPGSAWARLHGAPRRQNRHPSPHVN